MLLVLPYYRHLSVGHVSLPRRSSYSTLLVHVPLPFSLPPPIPPPSFSFSLPLLSKTLFVILTPSTFMAVILIGVFRNTEFAGLSFSTLFVYCLFLVTIVSLNYGTDEDGKRKTEGA